MIELHGVDTGSRVSHYMSAMVRDHDLLDDLRPELAIDGLYIHLVCGELGVRRIGMVTRAANPMRQKAIKLGLRTVAAFESGTER